MDIDPITIVRTVMAINYKRIQERYPNPNRRDTLTQTGEIPLFPNPNLFLRRCVADYEGARYSYNIYHGRAPQGL